MTDQPENKPRIRPLTDKSDYSLWRARIMSACSGKSLSDVFEDKTDGSRPTDEAFNKRCSQVSDLIVSALSDDAMRIVMDVIGDPKTMISKLDDRYRSKSTASKISKITELVSIRYKNVRKDIAKHVDKMSGIVSELKGMKMNLEDTLTVGVLVASIEAPELSAVAAAIKTLAEDDLKWENVAARFIEEWKNLKSDTFKGQANRATVECDFCGREGHTQDDCWVNPENPNNRLGLKKKAKGKGKKVKKKTDSDDESADEQRTNGKKKKSKGQKSQRAAMARTKSRNPKRSADKMLLDSGTTSHMTPYVHLVKNKEYCNVSISLADDSTISADEIGVRPVMWKGENGPIEVTLSDTLVTPDAAVILLYLLVIVNKGIAVLFVVRCKGGSSNFCTCTWLHTTTFTQRSARAWNVHARDARGCTCVVGYGVPASRTVHALWMVVYLSLVLYVCSMCA